jgi:hypothetical protein
MDTKKHNKANMPPEWKKDTSMDAVELIAENVRNLISFGEKTAESLRSLQKISIKPEKL